MGRNSIRIRDEQPGSYFLELRNHFFGCFGVKILKFLDGDPGWRAKIEILIKLFLENVEIFHNYLKLPFFGLKIRLLFTDLFRIRFWIRIRIRIRNVYFGPGSDPDPAKSFGSLRIRIRNTGMSYVLRVQKIIKIQSFVTSNNKIPTKMPGTPATSRTPATARTPSIAGSLATAKTATTHQQQQGRHQLQGP